MSHNKPQRLAILDVGTLKSKFEIRQYNTDGTYEILYKDKKLTVLGRDLPKTNGFIIDSAIETTIVALKEFKKKMAAYKVDSYRAITTEAVRKASNAKQVLDRIRTETTLSLEILTHEDEAKLFFSFIANKIPHKKLAVADIGGGSVQLIIGTGEHIDYVHLFKTGTYFLQEEFSSSHHPSQQELMHARDYIQREFALLQAHRTRVDELIYGSSNIIDFMRAMKIPLRPSGYDSSHPYRVTRDNLEKLYKKVISLSYEDRMPMFPEEPYYMWAADKALMNIFAIMDSLHIDTVIPTNENISSGLFETLRKT